MIAQLGYCLVQNGMSAEAMLAQWDENGDGVLSSSEFRELFRKLGAENEKTASFSVLMTRCSDDEVCCPDHGTPDRTQCLACCCCTSSTHCAARAPDNL